MTGLTVETLAARLEAVLRMLDAKSPDEHLIPSAVQWVRAQVREALGLLPQLGAGAPPEELVEELWHGIRAYGAAQPGLSGNSVVRAKAQAAETAARARIGEAVRALVGVGATGRVERFADAPEGPWRAHKAAIEDWWEVERDGGAEYFGPRLFATKVEAIAVRDALNRVASQGEKPT